MKLPGKRDRKRRASERNQALPSVVPTSSPSPAPSPQPTPTPVAAPPSAPASGGRSPALLVLGILFFLGVLPVASLFSKASPNAAQQPSSSPDPQPESRALTVKPAEPPREPRFEGNGYEAFKEALTKTPARGVVAGQEIDRLIVDPRAKLGTEGLRWARDAWPAVKLLERATCSTAFLRSETPALDTLKLQSLAVAALATARLQTEKRPAESVGRWSIRLVRLGHELAQGAPPLDAVGALAVARLGERWLKSSLEHNEWNAAERAWAKEQLEQALHARADRVAIVTSDTKDMATNGAATAAQAEKQALEDLVRITATSMKVERH